MLNNQAKVSLHCTFNVEGLDWTVLTLFVATQMYSPLSPLITFVMVNVLLFSLKVIPEVVFTTEPSLVHENVGAGLPTALQVKVTFSPSVFVLFCGCVLNSGWSVIRRQCIWSRKYGKIADVKWVLNSLKMTFVHLKAQITSNLGYYYGIHNRTVFRRWECGCRNANCI